MHVEARGQLCGLSTLAQLAKTSTRFAGQMPLSDESSHQPLSGFVTAASAKETGSR